MAQPSNTASARAPHGSGIMWQRTQPVDFKKPLVTSDLKGQSAIVTGGSSGIGAGMVVALAEAGAYVTSADMNENGQKTVDELTARGLAAQFIKTDVLSWSSLTSAFRAAINFAPHKTLDIVITAAGLVSHSIVPWLAETPIDTPDTDLKPFDSKTLEVNLLGTWYCTQLALHFFRFPASGATKIPSTRSKQIILLSSAAGYGNYDAHCDYAISKTGVRGLFYSLRRCTGILGHGEIDGAPLFRTNLIAPWFVRTNMISSYMKTLDQIGMRIAEVSDAVDGILRCLTDENVIGRAIMIAPEGKDGNNFDVCDDLDQGFGGYEMMKRVKSGLIQSDLLEKMGGKPDDAPKWTDS